ncbi:MULTISPECIES: thiosulfate oxidation carrier complex protein SoxZ [unclassified Thioalkalivibrio]|uniref:thiosulfate oxidation carrier complex protein SoxZ n=1 Tax=unclassified Thioalkalivibrio TaxID=2621013 RepID=UPI0005715AB9|nr:MULTISPECIES: thiosulfate oxidation carrier complex protein SoxZ [unclassified Thioalkalivibrio]
MSIRVRAQESNGVVNVRALMSHDMLVPDDDGGPHFIETVEIKRNGEDAVTAHWNFTVSRNPFLQVEFDGSAGDTVSVSWTDNKGESDSTEVEVG